MPNVADDFLNGGCYLVVNIGENTRIFIADAMEF